MSGAAPKDLLAVLEQKSLVDALAAVEHERWSHWQRYLHSQCEPGDDGALTIPAALVERWNSQLSKPYAALAEEEKESDREQVKRYLPIIAAALQDLRA